MLNKNINTMKNRNYLFVLLVAVGLVSMTLAGCSKDEENEEPQPQNLVEVASANSQFSILVEALQKANLAETLKGSGPFTVFAPTNDAFNALFSQLGVTGINDLTVDQLKPILLYHVLSGKLTSNQLSNGYVSTLSPGPGNLGISLKVDVASLKLNGNVSITSADIDAANGVIHVIDKVLLPPTIVDIALANNDFTTLTAAVLKANLATTLQGNGTYTVFAPTNAAFSSLFNTLGISGLESLSAETLTPILLYHVLGSVINSSQLQSGYISTLSSGPNNASISLNVDAANAKLNGDVNIVLTDIVGSNGIIHVIDKVLLPPSIVDLALGNPNFSILVSALVKAELVETLNGPGPFTVFAPTNDAFNKLFNQLGISGIDQLTKEDLTPILLYHVVSGNIKSNQLTSGPVETLNGNINIEIGNPVTINGSAKVLLTDVQGTNGVIHVIDEVLIPSGK